jgi:hypothetical protein
MKRLAFIAAILTSASAAYAQGWYRPYNNTPQPYHYGEHWRGGWEPLADRYSTDSERQFIDPGPRPLRRLRVEAVDGRPVIDQIAVQYADGTTQVIHRPLRWRERVRDIDLNGGARRVNRVIVYANTRSQGTYSVFGA